MLKVLKPGLGRLLAPAGRALARTPVTPNMITVIGAIGMTAGALTLFPTGHLFAGTMVCTGFVLSDMLDGALARAQGSTGAFGAFLDSTLDRVGDAAVFVGIAIWLATGGHDRLVAIGLAGLGVPYVLSVGLWILAVLSAITFGQRVNAVRRATARSRAGDLD